MSAPQDSHQAVATLLQQQTAQSPPPNSHGAVDSLTCQWAHCGERCSSPEALYEHVCERHVGRKSTNNLNLQCQWGTCRTTTVKRDHITSHIRVHVPLKPHKCEQCGKSFKRPQDLKKHVKTHADDSVLLRSPDPNSAAAAARGPGANNGFQQNASKGFYPDPSGQGHSQAPPYGYHPGVAQNYGAAMHGQGAQHGNYGPVYYPNPQSVGYADGNQLTESRKRGHDALNDFFSMIKRRDVDPAQYMDLGSRIGGVQSMPIPMTMGGYQNPYGHGGMEADYGGTAAMYHPAQVPQFQYSLPFTELKTKNDLLSIDSFLEQLQHTVYEQPAPQQAVNNAIDPRFQNPTGRDSDSPPHLPSISASSHTGSTTDEAASTPGLTPGSFSHSPRSAHSSSVAPTSRPSGGLYPHLPSVSAMTDSQINGYSSQTSAPPSGLGNNFEEFDGRRRYSGNYLQRARQSPQDKESPTSENSAERDAKSPKSAEGAKLPGIHNLTRRDSEGSGDQRESQWLDNMRIIETLRTYLSTRLQKGQFEGGEGEMDMADEDRESTPRPGPREGEADGDGDVKMGMTDREREAGSLYPVLKAVEGN